MVCKLKLREIYKTPKSTRRATFLRVFVFFEKLNLKILNL